MIPHSDQLLKNHKVNKDNDLKLLKMGHYHMEFQLQSTVYAQWWCSHHNNPTFLSLKTADSSVNANDAIHNVGLVHSNSNGK